jgi:predicted HicB family RNase H-like nuclease
MKEKNLSYNNYLGSIEVDIENGVLFGQILFINDTITFEAPDLTKLKVEFEEAVDDYLETCRQLKREPQKTCSGTFNIRVGEQVHRDAAFYAHARGQKLNDFCKDALEEKIASLKNGKKETCPIVRTTIHLHNLTQETGNSSAMRAEFLTVAEYDTDDSDTNGLI